MSVYCNWVRWKVLSATSISVWQHVHLSEQIPPLDTLACCWDVKLPTNKQPPPRFFQEGSFTILPQPHTRYICPQGKTLAAGSLAGLVGRKPNDTSPARSPEPAKPEKVPATKNPSTKLDQEADQPNSVARKVKDNKVKAKDTAAASKDNCECVQDVKVSGIAILLPTVMFSSYKFHDHVISVS